MNQYSGFNSFQPYQPFQQRQNLDWIMVQTVEQVESVSVQPNGKAWIMVQNEPIFAVRTADMMGLTTTKYFRFEEFDPRQMKQNAEYVTASQLAEAIERLKGELKNESIIHAETGKQ